MAPAYPTAWRRGSRTPYQATPYSSGRFARGQKGSVPTGGIYKPGSWSGMAAKAQAQTIRGAMSGMQQAVQYPMSLGELVPYQAGPRTTPGAPRHGINLTQQLSKGYAGQMTKQAQRAAQRAIMRSLLAATLRRMAGLGNTAYNLVDLAIDFGVWDWWFNPTTGQVLYDHPPNAELLLKCDGVPLTSGPHGNPVDGACGIQNVASTAQWESSLSPGYTDGALFRVWRYVEGPLPSVGDNVEFRKAEGWRAPLSTAGSKPGPLTTSPPTGFPMPNNLPAEQVGVRGDGGFKVPTGAREGFPRARRSERKKGLAQRGYGLAVGLYDKGDELAQAIDIIWDSMKGPCKGRAGKNRLQKASDIARCAGTINVGEMVLGLLANHYEDKLIGAAHRAGSQPIRGSSGPRSGIGPAF